MANIVESTTNSITVTAGQEYVFAIAGTWDGMTATLKWNDGTTDVSIQAFTSDDSIIVTAPTGTLKVVTGADSTNAGSLIYSISEILEGKTATSTAYKIA